MRNGQYLVYFNYSFESAQEIRKGRDAISKEKSKTINNSICNKDIKQVKFKKKIVDSGKII